MLIYKLHVPPDFATLTPLASDDAEPECLECRWAPTPRPLEVVWDRGSDVVEDFVFGYGFVFAKESVGAEVAGTFGGISLHELEMLPDELGGKPRVALPYQGPPLCELVPTRQVELLPRSTVEIEEQCGQCGRVTYKRFLGLERRSGRLHTPRKPEHGLFFDSVELSGVHIFQPRNTGLFLCDETVKEFVTTQGYSNVEFLQVGELL